MRALIALSLIAIVCPARAEDRNAAKVHFQAGRLLAQKGDHRAAIVEFERALEAAPGMPSVIYNLAHEHHALGIAGSTDDVRRAIDHYRRYLAASKEAPDRREVAGFLVELEKKLPVAPAAPAITPPPPSTVQAPPPPLTATPPPTATPTAETPPPLAAPQPVAASPVPIAASGVAEAAPARSSEAVPVYRRWWLWSAILAAVVAGSAVTLTVALTPNDAIPPASDLGSMAIRF